MKTILPVLMLAPLSLGACMPETSAPDTVVVVTPGIATDTCGASRYQTLIGQSGPVISVPAHAAYRSYKTGDPVTMDFNPTRLNFEHDKTGKLVRVSCG